MKKLLFILTFFFSFFANAQIEEIIPKKQSPPKLVNDFTNTLTEVQNKLLKQNWWRMMIQHLIKLR